MLRKLNRKYNKSDKKTYFGVVKNDRFLKFAGICGENKIKSFLQRLVLSERERFVNK